ncbi:hypothetical protein BJY14_006780 [Actinomadura luteofluorescens]|uniref:Uncharacterized protein n=1 Tax=Actinomadura luteofluorescens TaxID=46163 RepID=A0A7Y9JIU4_9ACTN|nr:hypothetical protein [Actinomadura luteofluorescens]
MDRAIAARTLPRHEVMIAGQNLAPLPSGNAGPRQPPNRAPGRSAADGLGTETLPKQVMGHRGFHTGRLPCW